MISPEKPGNAVILVAEDDEDDRFMIQEAINITMKDCRLHFTTDGEDTLNYLNNRGDYEKENNPRPDLILLDINMPRKNGFEVLQAIKSDSHLRRIPVIMFTTSRAQEDIDRSYDLGSNSYIMKPLSFTQLLDTTRALKTYWLHLNQPYKKLGAKFAG